MTLFCSFSWLSNIPSHIHTTSSLSKMTISYWRHVDIHQCVSLDWFLFFLGPRKGLEGCEVFFPWRRVDVVSVQFSSVAQSCPTLCDPIYYSTPGLPVIHYLSEFAQTYVLWLSDAIQPFQPLLSPSPPAFNLSQHQGLFQWVGSLHQVAKVLEFQL